MKLTISRDPADCREDGSCLLFGATDAARRRVTVAISHQGWEIVRRDAIGDPYLDLERLAFRGHWAEHGGRSVWHVDVI